MPRIQETDTENIFYAKSQTDGRKDKPKSDIQAKIEKSFRAIEEKLDIPENNIVEESIQKSMYGVFLKNFKYMKDTQPN